MRNNTSVTPLLLQSTRVPDEYDTFLPGVISGKVLPKNSEKIKGRVFSDKVSP